MKTVRRATPIIAAALLAAAHPALAQPTVRLPAADRVLGGTPTAAFTLGTRAPLFSDVAQVAFGPNEQLFVLDRGAHRVSVFDGAGRSVRSFGTRGTAAGQLLAPMQIAVTRDGEVVVSDLARRRYVVFGVDGRLRRELPFESGELPGLTMRPSPRGGVVASVRPASTRGPLGGASSSTLSLVWQPVAAGARATRLFQYAEEAVQTADAPTRGEGRIVASGPPVFAPGMQWGVLPDGGVAVAHSAGYSVRVVAPNGAAARVIERAIAPRRVTNRDRERARERQRAALSSGRGVTIISTSGGSLPRELIEEQLAGMRFASVVPVVQGITAAASGTLWIERAGPDTGAPGPIDLITAAGRYVGTLTGQRRPDAISPTGRAAYVETDAAGRSVVVVRVLPPGWR